MEDRLIKRVLLKISGEMLGGPENIGFHQESVELVAHEIADLHFKGYEVAAVVGGGNLFRGVLGHKFGMERSSADYMGMLATCMNALAIQGILENKFKLHTRVMTAIHMPELAEPYIRRKAAKHLSEKRVVLLAGGTGNPLFTTDTAASLRALELECDIILKATKVDGIFDSDPMKNPNAKKLTDLKYLDVISQQLGVMDATAITMCMEGKMPVKVFKLEKEGSVVAAVRDNKIGTTVS